ncbi:hypothetical protein ACFE04_020345 [Oxalis oulophora]
MAAAAAAAAANRIPTMAVGSLEIPMIGYGTAEYPLGGNPEIMKDSILHAIKVGYRHFDTAALYLSEAPLGQAITTAIHNGFIQSRDDLFITSKLYCNDAHPHLVLSALKKSLQALKMDYIDLYLIHWPVSAKPGEFEFPIGQDNFLPMDYNGVWKAMEECQLLGLTKLIGVSNFSIKKLKLILDQAKIPPAVNQVIMNPMWQQKKLREFCQEKGIVITAYSPLGAKGTPWGSNNVMDSKLLQQIAHAKGKSLAQICLRWAYEQQVVILVKSFRKERIEENIDIFDWKLSDEESEKLSLIPQERGWPALEFVNENGPFKSLEQLWDGEI